MKYNSIAGKELESLANLELSIFSDSSSLSASYVRNFSITHEMKLGYPLNLSI